MSGLPVQRDSRVPNVRIGPGNVGYADLPPFGSARCGICVRLRPDGTPRLVFDLSIYFDERNREADHVRLRETEFTMEVLPGDIKFVLGQDNWNALRQLNPSPGTSRWRPLPDNSQLSSHWKSADISVLDWNVGFDWPVSAQWPGWPPRLLDRPIKLAIWHGCGSMCVVNPNWLKSPHDHRMLKPELFHDDQYTYFFPECPP